MEPGGTEAWKLHGRRLSGYSVGGDYPDEEFSTIVAVSVGIGCSLVLILICLAACCGCMIPSEDCFQRLLASPAHLKAWCWYPCCCWRRHHSSKWINPELDPPKHFEKHRPFFEVDEDGPKGWGEMSQEQKEALANVIMTMSDISDTIPTELDLPVSFDPKTVTLHV